MTDDTAQARLQLLLDREPGIFSRQEEADLRAVLDIVGKVPQLIGIEKARTACAEKLLADVTAENEQLRAMSWPDEQPQDACRDTFGCDEGCRCGGGKRFVCALPAGHALHAGDGHNWLKDHTRSWPEDEQAQEPPAAIEVRCFADLCEAMDRLGVTFVGELRPREAVQPQDVRDAEPDLATEQAKARYRDTRTHILAALGDHCSYPHISTAADAVTALVKPQLEAVYAAGLCTLAELEQLKRDAPQDERDAKARDAQ